MDAATATRTQTVAPVVAVPTEDDLRPLYQAADRYRAACKARWETFDRLKDEVGCGNGGFCRDIDAVYAHPDYKRDDPTIRRTGEKSRATPGTS